MTPPRRVLVTGAGGFVGRSLATGFADLGWRVVALDRAFDAGWAPSGVELATADLAEGVPSDVPAVDLVVHAAWLTTDPTALGIPVAEHLARNLRPLLTVLEHTLRVPPAVFVFLSSSGVFSASDATEGLTDDRHPTGDGPYAVAKRIGELLVPAALPAETAAHVVRLGHLYGPGEVARPSRQRVSLVAGWLEAARHGRPLEVRSDDPARDWTFTPDLAAALERVVGGEPAGRPVHLGSPFVHRDRALAELVAAEHPGVELVGVPATQPVKAPMVPSDLLALRDFPWTDPRSGLRALLAEGVAA